MVYEFAQGQYYEYNLYQSDLDAYIFSKLCWNFKRSVQELMDEYNYYYFGADAFDDIRAFHNELNDRYDYMASNGEDMIANDRLTKEIYWPYATTKKLVQYFDDAAAKTRANEELSEEQKAVYIENIERAELSPMWMRLTMFDRYAGVEEEHAEFAKRFVEMGNKYNLVRYGEDPARTFASIKAKYGLE